VFVTSKCLAELGWNATLTFNAKDYN